MHKIFWYPKFPEKQMGSKPTLFGIVRLQNFDGKSWYPFSFPQLFFKLEFCWKVEAFPDNFFGTVRQGNFDKFVIPLLTKKILGIRTSPEHKVPPYKVFRYCEKKKLPETRGIRPSLNQFFFRFQKFSEAQKVSMT